MKYTSKYFKDNLPEWKRQKDPILSRIFYRPISFYGAAFCANHGISANTVSYFSALIAIVAGCLFLVDSYEINIMAAMLVNVWLCLDCVDGNIARSIKKQPFGDFADSISSYILVGIMCTTMSTVAYRNGGYFIESGCIWIVILGAFSSSADTLMRLIYQKYKATARELIDRGIIQAEEDKRTDITQVNSWQVRIESDFGVGGILPILVLIGTIFNILDIVVCYCFLYYGGACVVASLLQIRKAMKYTKECERDLNIL